jgi:hypothetical protein
MAGKLRNSIIINFEPGTWNFEQETQNEKREKKVD